MTVVGLVIARLLASLGIGLLAGSALLSFLDETRRMRPSLAAGLGAVAACGIILQLVLSAHAAWPGEASFAWQPVLLFAGKTWGGRILLVRLVLVCAILMWIGALRRKPRGLGVLLIGASLFAMPFSGHAVTAGSEAFSLPLHGLHTAATLTWAGTVGMLAAAVIREGDAQAARLLLKRFSPVALALVLTGIGTGVAAAWLQAGSPAALLGTLYGQLVLLKAVPLLGLALASAAWLRWVFIPGQEHSPRRALLIESAACAGMLAAASILSQSIPGRHDDIVWPLPFRFDWRLLAAGQETRAVLAGHLIFAAAMLIAALGGVAMRRWALAGATGFAAVAIGGLGLTGLAIPAYPTTYAASSSSYSAERLIKAEKLFANLCTQCHGRTGHGDGPAMVIQDLRAADLTLHSGDHTAGDMYWWITHGRDGTVMEGVEAVTSAAERWDLVNYVRLLANSARSFEVGHDISPLQPFLPSIDFPLPPGRTGLTSLRDAEGERPVLLVLGREEGSLARLEELRRSKTGLADSGLAVVFVAGPEIRDRPLQSGGEDGAIVITSGSDAIIRAWSYYRRAYLYRDLDDLDLNVGHQEFLIDGFGYVRGKWRSDYGLFPSIDAVLEDVRELAREPRLLPPPEDHLH